VDPIRIKFCENVDHFVEAQDQQPPPRPLIPEKNLNLLLGVFLVGTFIFFLFREYKKGTDWKILPFGLLFFIVVCGFWLWLFKKLGLFKKRPAKYVWSEKDRNRFKATYLKQTGREETLVTCEFNQDGFLLGPENEENTTHAWNNLNRVVERPKGLLIYIRKSVYFWIPRRSFIAPAEYLNLVEFLKVNVAGFQEFKLAILALGSNLGDSAKALRTALRQLEDFSDDVILKSSLWQTTPVDCPPDSPQFLNAVVGFVPQENETPETLLAKLQELEKNFGRQTKKVLNEPRPLDLDLIAFGSEVRNSPQLTLPHPRAHLRRFVLQPLSEIAPELILPGQTRTVLELLAALPAGEQCVKI